MVRDFQSIIGEEAKKQILKKKINFKCLGCLYRGGSNALGLFHPFLDDEEVEIFEVEAAGKGLKSNLHAASHNWFSWNTTEIEHIYYRIMTDK